MVLFESEISKAFIHHPGIMSKETQCEVLWNVRGEFEFIHFRCEDCLFFDEYFIDDAQKINL